MGFPSFRMQIHVSFHVKGALPEEGIFHGFREMQRCQGNIAR